MSVVEAAPPPPRPPPPSSSLAALSKDKKGKPRAKTGGYSVDLESMDFEDRSGIESRRRSQTLGSRPPARSRNQEKPPASVPHVIDSSGRSPKTATKAEKSSAPPSRPNRPPPPRNSTQPQLVRAVSQPSTPSALPGTQRDEEEEPRYEGVPWPVLRKLQQSQEEEGEREYEGVAVLRRRLSSEGSIGAERPPKNVVKRYSSPHGSREVSPMPQLPEGAITNPTIPPPTTTSLPPKNTPIGSTPTPSSPAGPPPVVPRRPRSVSSPSRGATPPRATPPPPISIPPPQAVPSSVTTPPPQIVPPPVMPPPQAPPTVTTPPPQAPPTVTTPPPQTPPIVTTPPPQTSPRTLNSPPPQAVGISKTKKPISPTRKDSNSSPSHLSQTTPTQGNASPGTEPDKFSFPSTTDKNTEQSNTPVVPPRPYIPPRPFPPNASTSNSKRAHKKPHPSSGSRPTNAPRPTSAPAKSANSTDPLIPARPKISPSHPKRKSPRRTKQHQQEQPSKSQDVQRSVSEDTGKKSPQLSPVLVDTNESVPEEIKSPDSVPVSPKSPATKELDTTTPPQSHDQSHDLFNQSQSPPQVFSPSSASPDLTEKEPEVGVVEGGVQKQDYGRQQSSDHEGEKEDAVNALPPSASPNQSGGKGRKIMASMKKSFRSLRSIRVRRPPEAGRSNRLHSDGDIRFHKGYPDPLPQGIIHPIVIQCVAYLNRESVLVEEGLFRVPGDLAVIKRLREDFMQGYDVDLMEVLDPHTVAGLLKLHFREQKASLIPRGLPLTQLMAHVKNRDVEAVRGEFDKMEVINVATLSIVIEVLAKIVSHSSKNLMTSGIIATSCGPSIFPYLPPSNANQMTKFLIDNCIAIFKTGAVVPTAIPVTE